MANSRRWVYLWLVFVFSFGVTQAVTVSVSLANCTVTQTADGTFTISGSATNGGGFYGVIYVYQSNNSTGDWALQKTVKNGYSGTVNFNEAVSVASGKYLQVTAQVAANGSNVVSQNNTITIPYTLTFKKVTLSLYNDKEYVVEYRLYQNGVVVGSLTLQPKTGIIQTFTVPSGDEVTVVEAITGLVLDDGVWVESVGAVTETELTTATPVDRASTDPSPAPETVVPDSTAPKSALPDASPTSKAIWQARPSNTNPSAQIDLVTNAVFREGIDKLYQIQKDKIDSDKKAEESALASVVTAGNSSTSAGVAAKSAVQALYGQGITGLSISTDNGAPDLTVSMPSAFGGATFDFNPFSNARFAAVCSWFRTATAWLVLVLLGTYIWSQVAEWTRGFSTIRQASGNAVLGGTGAQATALVAAGLMTVAVVVSITAILAWSMGDITLTFIKASALTNPLSGIPSGVFWMLNQVLPVTTIISAAVARMSFNMYAAPLFAGCAAVVRFIVP